MAKKADKNNFGKRLIDKGLDFIKFETKKESGKEISKNK